MSLLHLLPAEVKRAVQDTSPFVSPARRLAAERAAEAAAADQAAQMLEDLERPQQPLGFDQDRLGDLVAEAERADAERRHRQYLADRAERNRFDMPGAAGRQALVDEAAAAAERARLAGVREQAAREAAAAAATAAAVASHRHRDAADELVLVAQERDGIVQRERAAFTGVTDVAPPPEALAGVDARLEQARRRVVATRDEEQRLAAAAKAAQTVADTAARLAHVATDESQRAAAVAAFYQLAGARIGALVEELHPLLRQLQATTHNGTASDREMARTRVRRLLVAVGLI